MPIALKQKVIHTKQKKKPITGSQKSMNALCKLAVDSAVVVDVHMIQVPDSVVKLANL